MKKWLKRYFIPHEENGHRPHFLHRKNASQLVGIVLFFELILFVFPALNFTGFLGSLNLTAVLPGVLSALTNAERFENNLPELKESSVLNEAARLKAEDMASKSYFAHTSPEGVTPWYWLEKAGYSYVYAGENLAVNFIDSADVTEAWMNSPTHRANIVHAAYTEVGTGVATGMYKGREAIFVAQVYGRPAIISAPISNSSNLPNYSKNTPAPAPSPQPTTNVLGESRARTTGFKQAVEENFKNFIEESAASPRRATDAMLYSVLGLVALALIFNIFIRIRHQHPDLILNGAMVVAVILALHIGNSYISRGRSLETTFLAFDSQTQILGQE